MSPKKSFSQKAKKALRLNKQDSLGMSPFHYAIEKGETENVADMIEHGAEVNGRVGKRSAWTHLVTHRPYEDDTSPLHIAAFQGYTTMSELLIKHGAEVNALDKKGWTPLDHAIAARNYYNQKLDKKNKNALARASTREKLGDSIKRYDRTIDYMLSCGAKTSFYDLPEPHKQARKPRQTL